METKNRPHEEEQDRSGQQSSEQKVKNPFENNQSADQDISQSQEEVDKEQQFKEALTERD